MDRADVLEGITGLVGRERECAALDRLLERAVEGDSGSLVIRGEAGIGKTALLGYADRRARGHAMTVLRATGVEAESDLAFAGLYGLARPVLGHLDAVPEMHRGALAGALGLAPSTQPDRFLVCAGVLGLLAAAAEPQPILCLVDDAQWLDQPSAEALVFAARRLRAERVAMLFASREGEGHRVGTQALPELIVTGLEESSAAEVLAKRGREITPVVRGRLLSEANGNPLALLELPAALSDDQLAGAAPLPDAIPLTPRLRDVFTERLERLPDATQLVLALAAAEDTGDLAIVLRAADRLELTPEALEPGEQAELVQIDGATITFRHPLARSAVYAGATALRRQRIHAALAEVLTAEEHSDRRVWHQALATVTPDEEVAAALEASARRARARAAPASAATAWLRAAGLSTDEGRRGQRLAAAGQAAWDAGQLDRTREVLAQALPTATGEVRARLLHLRGVLEWRAGTLHDAYPALIEGANLTADPTLEIEMLFDAADVAALSGELDRIVALGPRVKEIPALTALDRCRQLLLSGFAQLSAGDVDAARALFAQGLEAAGELDDPRTLLWASQAASAAGDLGSGLPYAARAVQLARTKGRFSLVQIALHRYAASLFADSQFEAAYATAQEAYRLSLDSGAQLIGGHLTTMAAVEAAWGREQEAFAHAEQALGMARQRGAGSLEETAEWALGFIDLSGGRYDAAADRLLRITGASRPETSPLIWGRTVADAVEAATRSDRHTEAVERLTWFRAWVELAPTDRRRAILARCEALLDPRASAGAFSEALELADALPAFQRARTELLYGEWLRRERRRQEARSHLRRARELFYGLRAVPWEKRAEAELRATGETTRARNPSTLDQLTPQELQIGGLVAQGLTNREVAAQLYLSPRTVDYHLRKVFSKLGIASRIELVRNGLPPREHA